MSQRLSKPFWPPALVQQAPPAILLAALRRFRGPALFLGLRPSSSQGAPFWPSGLTLRSSGPAYGGPLTLAVSLLTLRPAQPMPLQTTATRSSACAVVRGRRGGLRRLGLWGVQGFWGACASPRGTSSSFFYSAVSNSALKPTRILRAAYLVR